MPSVSPQNPKNKMNMKIKTNISTDESTQTIEVIFYHTFLHVGKKIPIYT